MKKYWGEMPYYEQPTTGEIKRRSSETKKREKAKGKVLEPVVIQGRNIVKNWWGMAWCNNLEQYADYSSRIDRGKRYVRTGAVIDLKIEKGKVSAKVQGKRPIRPKSGLVRCLRNAVSRLSVNAEKNLRMSRSFWRGGFRKKWKSFFAEKTDCFRVRGKSALPAAVPTGR